jgi:hypothetical protein
MGGETPTTLLLVLVVALILIAVGIFVITLVYFQRSMAKKQSRAAAAKTPPLPASAPVAPIQAPAEAATEPVPDAPARPGQVMCVVRDEQTGRILVEVDGIQYAHIREIKDAQVGRRVLWAIADLIRFTGGMAATPQALRGAAPETPEPAATLVDTPARAPEPAAPPVRTPVRTPEPAEANAFALPSAATTVAGRRPTAVPAQQPESAPQRYNMIDFFRRGFGPASTTTTAAPRSFIDEIEDILQAYIAALPRPLPQDVHVTTSDTGKLQIQVGLKTYGSPEEVPDPQIRDLIKAAVADWERR